MRTLAKFCFILSTEEHQRFRGSQSAVLSLSGVAVWWQYIGLYRHIAAFNRQDSRPKMADAHDVLQHAEVRYSTQKIIFASSKCAPAHINFGHGDVDSQSSTVSLLRGTNVTQEEFPVKSHHGWRSLRLIIATLKTVNGCFVGMDYESDEDNLSGER